MADETGTAPGKAPPPNVDDLEEGLALLGKTLDDYTEAKENGNSLTIHIAMNLFLLVIMASMREGVLTTEGVAKMFLRLQGHVLGASERTH